MDKQLFDKIVNFSDLSASSELEVQESRKLLHEIFQKYKSLANFVDYNPENKIEVFQIVTSGDRTDIVFHKITIKFNHEDISHTIEYADWVSGQGSRELRRQSYGQKRGGYERKYSLPNGAPTVSELRAVEAFIDSVVIPEIKFEDCLIVDELVCDKLSEGVILSEGDLYAKEIVVSGKFGLVGSSLSDDEKVYKLILGLVIQNILCNGVVSVDELTTNQEVIHRIKSFNVSNLNINSKIIDLLKVYVATTYSGEGTGRLSGIIWADFENKSVALESFRNPELKAPKDDLRLIQAISGRVAKMIFEQLEVIN